MISLGCQQLVTSISIAIPTICDALRDLVAFVQLKNVKAPIEECYF